MRKTLFSLFAFMLIGTGAFAQNIQASLRYETVSEDVIITIRNNGASSYTGNMTSFFIAVGLGNLDYRLRKTYYTFTPERVTYDYYTSMQRPYYLISWTGTFEIDLAPGETLDLVKTKLADTWISTSPPRPALVAMRSPGDPDLPLSVKINNIEVSDPLNSFYDTGIPGAYLANGELGSVYSIPAQFALPVKLAYLSASAEGNLVTLKWTTTEEVNSSSFEVQQSIDSKNWKSIGSVESHGESHSPEYYSFNHNALQPGNNYYRLKMIDRDLTYSFSKIEVVDIQTRPTVIYPNPVVSHFSFQDLDARDVTSVRIYSPQGKLVNQFEPSSNVVSVEQLLPGNYIAVVKKKDGSSVSHKFVKK